MKQDEEINLDNLPQVYKKRNNKLIKFLQICCAEIPNEIEILKSSFEANNKEILQNSAHKLKTIMYYLGQYGLRDELDTIEANSANEDVNKLSELIWHIEKEWKALEPKLSELINELSPQNSNVFNN